MKKTMVFENETAYDNWFDVNEEKEGGHDFLENRVVIIKETRTINGKKFNGFSADSTIECKNVRTAVRRFVKELNSNGFEVSVDDFECSINGENLNDLTGSGMVVKVEEIDDGRYYVTYMCYQDEVEEEIETEETTEESEATEAKLETATNFETSKAEMKTATETEVRVKRKPITTDIDMKEMFTEERATAKSLLNSAYGITAERETATDHTYEIRVFKNGLFICSCTFSFKSFAEFAFSIMEMNAKVFPEPCFKMIELFKDGKLVKMSEIYFGKIALEVKNG